MHNPRFLVGAMTKYKVYMIRASTDLVSCSRRCRAWISQLLLVLTPPKVVLDQYQRVHVVIANHLAELSRSIVLGAIRRLREDKYLVRLYHLIPTLLNRAEHVTHDAVWGS